jgi:hypothetical protein
MGKEKKGSGILGKIFLAVVVALLVGGTAPWWWGPLNQYLRSVGLFGTGTYTLELVGSPRFDFLGSGGGEGPPPYREGRYAFLSDVRVANHGDAQLVVREVRVALSNEAGLFAKGEDKLGSLDRWKIAAGQTDLVEVQVTTDVLQDQDKLKTRFELPPGQPKPRFRYSLHGTVSFDVLTATGESETKTFNLERFGVRIEPFGP